MHKHTYIVGIRGPHLLFWYTFEVIGDLETRSIGPPFAAQLGAVGNLCREKWRERRRGLERRWEREVIMESIVAVGSVPAACAWAGPGMAWLWKDDSRPQRCLD